MDTIAEQSNLSDLPANKEDDLMDTAEHEHFIAPTFTLATGNAFDAFDETTDNGQDLPEYYFQNCDGKSELHEVNVAGILHRCSDCIDDIKGEKPCAYCESEEHGITREKMWSSIPNCPDFVDFHETPIDGLKDYLIKLTELPGISRVLVYSHNGSRFDTHLDYRSLRQN
uniref:Uncharacterized protein n=1 Tax=Panagrolaimus superbus TaxID=310955 RepID=A0A914YS05_9BILA